MRTKIVKHLGQNLTKFYRIRAFKNKHENSGHAKARPSSSAGGGMINEN